MGKIKNAFGKIGHGILKGLDKINPLSSNKDENEQILTLVVDFFVLLGATLTFGGVYSYVQNNKIEDLSNNVEVLNDKFNTTVAEKAGLNDFYSSNCKLINGNEGNTLFVFGSHDVVHEDGNATKEFVQVKLLIDDISAENLGQKIKEKKDFDKEQSFNLTSNSGLTSTSSSINANLDSFSGDIEKKSLELSVGIYEGLNEAVAKAYECEVNKRGEASSMSRALSYAYRYTKPESFATSETQGWFAGSHNEFYSAGLFVTGISGVTRNKENDTATFYVDTLQSVDGANFTTHKAKVVVKGSNLSNEEVYDSFIQGDYLKFEEIVSTNIIENNAITVPYTIEKANKKTSSYDYEDENE